MSLKYPKKAKAWACHCNFSLTCVLEQESASCGPLAKFSCPLFWQMKFSWQHNHLCLLRQQRQLVLCYNHSIGVEHSQLSTPPGFASLDSTRRIEGRLNPLMGTREISGSTVPNVFTIVHKGFEHVWILVLRGLLEPSPADTEGQLQLWYKLHACKGKCLFSGPLQNKRSPTPALDYKGILLSS